MLKKKMVFFFHLLFLLSFGVSGEGQDSIVSVQSADLSEVASSILKAETWLKTHVLAHYPSTPITAIVVGGVGGVPLLLCRKEQEHTLTLILPAVKNLHHSLTRWGLQEHIKLSPAFAPSCFDRSSDIFGKFVRPVLDFLKGASQTVSPTLVSSHSESLEDFMGVSFNFDDYTVLLDNSGERKPSGRKLSADPFPARPTPLPKVSETPLHSTVGLSVPANVAKNPHPPLPQTASPPLQVPSPQPRSAASPPPLLLPSPEAQKASPPPLQIASPPDTGFSSAPESPPFVDDSPPPSPATFPPCRPTHVPPPTPAPQTAVHNKLWCVAKPTVPSDTLQVAMDYACGDGGADCSEIMPDGNCYSPDSVVAHASYAFNSYWQKNKKTGGTCSFDGTAMLINNDPSYLQCRFILT
ncbi:glucan endo-1,3-beta-glucosidase 13-like [Pyrus x bretschneideri]|uniref:glucan endo-1,3-beta-glucosidase 13-like n=1 Tax=Pyrus x bretschneideri TaxID=225117 RepID=UPI00202DD17D|nr:glucan endo-1,3-beta-glucosidase 13-like [Pyrus x bretschneideri]